MHCTSRSTAWECSVKLVEVPGASPLDRSYVAMGSRRSSESLSASPYCSLPRQILVSKGLRRGWTSKCATARPLFRLETFLPIIDVTASDIGRLLASSFSQRSRKLSLKTARLTLTTATQRPPTATGGIRVQGNPLAAANLAHLVLTSPAFLVVFAQGDNQGEDGQQRRIGSMVRCTRSMRSSRMEFLVDKELENSKRWSICLYLRGQEM
jgi:hypothetical protein